VSTQPQAGGSEEAAEPEFPGLGRVLVVIPTYNEADNIRQIVGRLRAAVPEASVLVADDASPDGTGDIADELATADRLVHVMHRAGKEGLGAAYIAGFGWASGAGYDVVVEMDADGSHAPEELPRVLTALRSADVTIGSRWISGGKVVNWPKYREAVSRFGNFYTRVALGMPLRDATAGFRAYRMTALNKLDLAAVASQGYCFQVDLTWQAYRAGLQIVEVPITFVERERGQSKMSLKIVVEAQLRVSLWGVQSRWAKLRGKR
jgi:dolichol-phosphate mannosyltransferase